MVIVKFSHQSHFTKRLDEKGTVSDRVILPGPDNCRVKVTRFRPQAGFKANKISNSTDEVVIILSGQIKVNLSFSSYKLAIPGSVYHLPAGEEVGIEVLEDAVAICVFSQAGANGPMPDDE